MFLEGKGSPTAELMLETDWFMSCVVEVMCCVSVFGIIGGATCMISQ